MNLNQLTIPATDLARSVAFYESLGLIWIVDALPRYVRFECPDGGTTFSLHHAEQVDPDSGFTIYFECPLLDQTITRLEAEGLVFTSPPTDQRWLWREAILRDPDGHRICLYDPGDNRRFPPWRRKEASADDQESSGRASPPMPRERSHSS